MDKAPPYLISSEEGKDGIIIIYPDDSEVMILIKKFMAFHGIIDIKMRMLKVVELKRIQGFPEDYILKGTQADQKKFIGNSVQPDTVCSWIESIAEELENVLPPFLLQEYFPTVNFN